MHLATRHLKPEYRKQMSEDRIQTKTIVICYWFQETDGGE